MATKVDTKRRRKTFWLTVGAIVFVCIFLYGMAVIHDSQLRAANYGQNIQSYTKGGVGSEDTPSEEPTSPGMREDDIQRIRGRRYSTY